MIDFMFVSVPSLWPEIADITRKNTRIGAIALSAPTNSAPNIVIPLTCSGTVSARAIPIIRPTNILFTRLRLFHFFIRLLIDYSSYNIIK